MARETMAAEPVTQRQQPADRGRELLHVLLAPASLIAHAYTRHHLRLVDVQRRRTLHDGLHPRPPSGRISHTDRRPGASDTNESDRRARSTLRSAGETPNAKLEA